MADDNPSDVTALLAAWRGGDQEALGRLMPLVQGELRRIAGRYLSRERRDHTLQATALVNEAYLRLVDQKKVDFAGSLHFIALAAQMMRRILVDHARGHRSAKRGAGGAKVTLEDVQLGDEKNPDVVAVDEALTELAREDTELARIVELRFFGGLKSEEIAQVLEVSVPTVTRRWRLARAWLYRYLSPEGVDGN